MADLTWEDITDVSIFVGDPEIAVIDIVCPVCAAPASIQTVVPSEAAYTCDGCGTTHWFTIGIPPTPTEETETR